MRDLAKLADVELPVGSLLDAAPHLRRPFSAAAVKWKVQTTFDNKRKAIVVGYIDARLVTERFNAVVPHLWTYEFEAVSAKLLLCRITVDGVTRPDVGEGTGKALYSDALKRAAVHFGVGVSVYALPQITLEVGTADQQMRSNYKGDPILDERTTKRLRGGYSTWLEATGIPMFGPVLDHGDVEDSQGADDEAVEGATEAEDAASAMPALTTVEAEALSVQIRNVYASIRKIAPRRLPPGEFRRKLDAAAHSMEELTALRDELATLHEGVPADAS